MDMDGLQIACGEEWLASTRLRGGGTLLDVLRDAYAGTGSTADAAAAALKAARDDGWWLASITDASDGISATPGTFNDVNVAFKAADSNEADRAEGRYYSSRQIISKFERHDVAPGRLFNYTRLYRAFYDLNSSPDLVAHVHLVNAEEETDDTGAKLGVQLEVEEAMPLHFTLGVDNYGTGPDDNDYALDKWMVRGTVQYLNLWKQDHALTASALSSFDASLYGGAASYYAPYSIGRRDAAVTVHGGYTIVDSEDVVPQIDVEGDGWFAGIQDSIELLPDIDGSLRAALGLTYREVGDRLVIHEEKGGKGYGQKKNTVDLLPLSLAFLYTSAREPDALMGRNFATAEIIHNLGGSSDDEMHRQRRAADSDYWVSHLQLARIQMIGGEHGDDGAWSGRHMLFGKLDAQYAMGNALVSAEQMGIGGANSVRGYQEREFLGDNAFTATLEYRTPLLLGYLDSARRDRLQFVVFGDLGYIGIEDALPGEDDSQFIAGAGLGLRFAWGEHFLSRFDWGVPLEKTDESDGGGRLYLSAQAQF